MSPPRNLSQLPNRVDRRLGASSPIALVGYLNVRRMFLAVRSCFDRWVAVYYVYGCMFSADFTGEFFDIHHWALIEQNNRKRRVGGAASRRPWQGST